MTINLVEIQNEINKITAEMTKLEDERENLRFITEKLLHGTYEEIRLIKLCTTMTIDNINLIIRSMKADMAKNHTWHPPANGTWNDPKDAQ